MTNTMMEEFEEAYAELERAEIWIDDVPKTAQKISAACRSLHAKSGLDWIGIDYLTLFRHDEQKKGGWNQSAEIGLDCLWMKYLAKELGVPVVLLCQLSRESLKREDKRPVLGDLRGSGNIEEHADVVAFVHRQGYYEPKEDNLKNKAEVIIAKNRNGEVGTVHLRWEPTYTRFSDPIDPREFETTDDWYNK